MGAAIGMTRSTGAVLFLRTLGASAFALVLTVIYSVLSARLLGVEGRGLLAAIQLWPSVCAGMLTFGLQTAFVYHSRRDPGLSATLFGTGFVASLFIASLIGVAASTALPALLPTLSDEDIEFSKTYFWMMLPITAASVYVGGCAQGIRNLRLFNRVRVLPLALQVVAILLLTAASAVTPSSLAIATIAAQTMVVIWALGTAVRVFGFRLSGFIRSLTVLIAFGSGVWAVEVLGVMTQQIDKIWISGALTLGDLGAYTLAFGMSRVVGTIQNSAATVIFPRNIGLAREDVVSSTAQVFRLSFWGMLITALPGSMLAAPIFPIVFGAGFATSGHVFPILVAECIVGTSSWVLAQAFNSLGKPHLIVLRQVSGLVTTVVAAWLLVPGFGIWGVAVAVTLGAVVRLAVTILSFPTGLGCPVPTLLLNRSDISFMKSILSGRVRRKVDGGLE